MNTEINHRIRLGIFVITGGLMLIIGLYFIGNNQNMFGSTFKIYTVFADVGGLRNGNNIRYSGIDVGTVESVEIKNDSSIVVEMVIDEKMKSFIRKNSIASVGTDGLMGNKLINIIPGTPDAPLIREGDEIPSTRSVNTDAMLRTLEFTNQNIAFVSANLRDITKTINRSRGTLYSVLVDTTLSTKITRTISNVEAISTNLSRITGELSSVSSDIKNGKGTVGALLKDTTLSNNIRAIMDEVKKSTEQFSLITNEVTEITYQIEKGNGTISKLVNDTVMSKHLEQSILNIQSSSQKLDESLEALKHSFLFRGYFNRQEKLKKKN
jgi:phospholipid/cholesterol/gamma-HCH transport system substrate-binding protein